VFVEHETAHASMSHVTDPTLCYSAADWTSSCGGGWWWVSTPSLTMLTFTWHSPDRNGREREREREREGKRASGLQRLLSVI
jgi:hypothetical protein